MANLLCLCHCACSSLAENLILLRCFCSLSLRGRLSEFPPLKVSRRRGLCLGAVLMSQGDWGGGTYLWVWWTRAGAGFWWTQAAREL